MPSQDLPAPRRSIRWLSIAVSASDADIIFTSTNSVQFNIHRKNLEANTHGFLPSGFATEAKKYALRESAATLELLFQFIYPMPQPDVPLLPFDTLAPLAEAVERYQVFPAMLICKIHMLKFLLKYPLEVMVYAAKSGYTTIVATAAPLVLNAPLGKVLGRLPASLVMPWALYHSAWERARRSARSFAAVCEMAQMRKEHKRQCHCNFDGTICDILVALDNVEAWQNLSCMFAAPTHSCQTVILCLKAWKKWVEAEIGTLEPFSSYLPTTLEVVCS